MGPGGMRLGVLKELPNETAIPLQFLKKVMVVGRFLIYLFFLLDNFSLSFTKAVLYLSIEPIQCLIYCMFRFFSFIFHSQLLSCICCSFLLIYSFYRKKK